MMKGQKVPEILVSPKEINRRIFSVILPITIEGLLEMTGGIILMGMIGRIDVLAINSLGISMQLTQIIWAIFKGISTGAAVFVSQYFGARKTKEMKEVIRQTILASLLVSLVCSVLVYITAPSILLVFNPDPELLRQSVLYMRIVCFGFPFWGIILIVGSVLQGMGDAKNPMLFVLLMNLINIAVGYALIFGHFGIASMGVEGAAIATVVSQTIAASVGLIYLLKKVEVLKDMKWKEIFSIQRRLVHKVFRMGAPIALEIMYWLFAGIIVSRAVMTFGHVTYAAHQLGVQAESISYMPASGFGIAAAAFVGQALGAKDKGLAKAYLKQIMKGTVLITIVSTTALMVFPSWIMRLLTNNTEVVRLGAIYLLLMGLAQVPQNLTGVYSGAMRGVGLTKIPMKVALVGLWGVRVPFILLFTYFFGFSILFIWITMSVDLFVRFILTLYIFRKNAIFDKEILE